MITKLRRWFTLALILMLTAAALPTVSKAQGGEKVLADAKLTSKINGFGFPNYGSEAPVTNLTSVEMRRIFGDGVCADETPTAEGGCTLNPVAEEYMKKTNDSMGGGHCEGMAVMALTFFNETTKHAEFGGSETPALTLNGNEQLQREIAYWWALQTTKEVVNARIAAVESAKNPTPSAIVDYLIEGLNKGELFTAAIFKREYKDGHAVTPYAVIDKGNGIYWVMLYDNNFPGEERHLEIDRNKDTWQYSASVNPSVPESLYEGDASVPTFIPVPLKARFPEGGKFACEFCAPKPSAKIDGLGYQTTTTHTVYFTSRSKDNAASILISDNQGGKIGYENGKFVNTFKGAIFQPIVGADLWADDASPIYYIPTGVPFTITVDGTGLKAEQISSLSVIGPGYEIGVDEIKLNAGEKDTLAFAGDGRQMTYTPASGEAPDISLSLSRAGADYEFLVKGFDLDAGGSVNIVLDVDAGQLRVGAKGSKNPAQYAITVDRYDEEGAEVNYFNDDLTLAPDETVFIEYGKWDGKGELTFQIDSTGDGTPDKTETKPNEKN